MRVVVVGGGLSGLFTAVELISAGVDDVVVVEAEDSPGGVARTIESDGFTLEPAVGSFRLPHPHLSPVLDRIGALTEPASPSSSVRYVYTNERLIGLPASPKALLAPVLSAGAKLRALAEPLTRADPPIGDESLEAFSRRRFGEGAGKMIAWLMASGIYAGDPAALSARSALPGLVDLEEQHGSVIRGGLRSRRSRSPDTPRPKPHLPVGGMSGLTEAGADFLGNRFRGGFQVDSVHAEGKKWVVDGPEPVVADHVVLACRPNRAAHLLGGSMGTRLEEAVSAPVVVVGLGGAGETTVPPGFGALVGPNEDMIVRGVLFESSYAPKRAPAGSWLVKVIAGGATDPGIVDMDDDLLVQRVGEETARVLGEDVDASFVEVIRHRPGIPQYNIGHGAWLANLDRMVVQRPGLHFTGWGYRGIGVTSLAEDASRIGSAIAADLGA